MPRRNFELRISDCELAWIRARSDSVLNSINRLLGWRLACEERVAETLSRFGIQEFEFFRVRLWDDVFPEARNQSVPCAGVRRHQETPEANQ